MSSRIASDSSKMMTELPPELIRSLSTQLSWSDILSLRATCGHWGNALAPLVKQLRIPLVPAPRTWCTHHLNSAASLVHPGEQLTAALSRLGNVNSVTLLLTEDTTPSDLQTALQIIGSKKNITKLVLCEMEGIGEGFMRPRTNAPPLPLSELVYVEDLKIRTLSWSLEDIWKQVSALASHPSNTNGSAGTDPGAPDGTSTSPVRPATPDDDSPRPYALRRLTIEQAPEKMYCSLLHDWHVNKFSCNLLDVALPSQLTHLSTPLPGQYNQAGEVVGPLNAAHEEYVGKLAAGLPDLLSLTISGVYEGKEEVFQEFQKPRELHCQPSIAFSAEPFDENLDSDEMSPTLLLASRVGALQRLRLLPQRRQGPDLLHTALPGWTRQEMAPPGRRFKLHWLEHNTELQHLAVKLVASGQDLAAVDNQLKSLTGQIVSSPSEDLLREVLAVGSGLTSLELFHKGRDLTSRSDEAVFIGRLLRMAQVPKPARPLHNLQSLTLIAERIHFYTVPDPAALWAQLPALHSLRLQNVGLGYSADGELSADRVVTVRTQRSGDQVSASLTKEDRLVLWLKDLPCSRLQQLELSQYAIVTFEPPVNADAASISTTTGSSSANQGGGAVAAVDANSIQPQQQQQQQQEGMEAEGEAVQGESEGTAAEGARLARLSLHDEDQQPQAVPDANSNGSSSDGNTSTDANSNTAGILCQQCDLSGLQHLALVDCSCLILSRQDDSGSNADAAAGPQPKPAWLTTVQALLARLNGPAADVAGRISSQCSSSLRTLWLDDVMMCLSAMQYLCRSPLCKQLQELHIHTRDWQDESGPAAVSSAPAPVSQQPHPDSAGIAAALTAAVTAGNLLKLRHLSLNLSVRGSAGPDIGVLGLPVLTACAGLTSLQELHVQLAAGTHGGSLREQAGSCGCQVGRAGSKTVPAFAGPWWDVLELQHLRVLEVTVLSSESRLAHREMRHNLQLPEMKEFVVGMCSRCGGAVSEGSLRKLMRCAAASRLSGCHPRLMVRPDGVEEWNAMLAAAARVAAELSS